MMATAVRTQLLGHSKTNVAGEPTGTETVGPAAGELTVYRIGYGPDHRGATWYDEAERVVWLCAYGLHRSGEDDEAFPHFHELISARTLLPTEADYAALFDDRGRGFTETLDEDAQQLLARARSNPGVEHVGLLRGKQTTSTLRTRTGSWSSRCQLAPCVSVAVRSAIA
jgi:hypothetical protein